MRRHVAAVGSCPCRPREGGAGPTSPPTRPRCRRRTAWKRGIFRRVVRPPFSYDERFMEPRAVSESSELADRSSVDAAAIGKYRLLAGLGRGGHGERVPRGRARPRRLQEARRHQAAARRAWRSRPRVPRRCSSTRRGSRRGSTTRTSCRRTRSVEDGSRYFIAMEYLDGQPLNAAARGVAPPAAFPLAMHLAHPRRRCSPAFTTRTSSRDFDGTPLGVVHRDVTPQNVFVTYDGQVKLARLRHRQGARLVERDAHRRCQGQGPRTWRPSRRAGDTSIGAPTSSPWA